MFADRREAGRALAAALTAYKDDDAVVLALPRGGVPVGYEIARALGAPLDVIVVRKLGAPDEPELGLGAVVDGDHPESVLNEEVVEALKISPEYLDNEIRIQLREIQRRQQIYRKGRPAPQLADRTVIVVDDGIATGGTIRAALRGVRRARPARLILAAPVAPSEAVQSLRAEADDVVCLETRADFDAIGQFYADFRQVSDDEVVALLERANAP
ncbi:MAG TPA: phosphoribosyltransferase [Candidatus Binataceae bacterium]|nr:phosphoribosyltransferase [Candidatus Binataceae bacterium]